MNIETYYLTEVLKELKNQIVFSDRANALLDLLELNLSNDLDWINIDDKLPELYQSVYLKLNTGVITSGFLLDRNSEHDLSFSVNLPDVSEIYLDSSNPPYYFKQLENSLKVIAWAKVEDL